MKIMQLIRIPIFLDEILVIPENKLYTEVSERGSGTLGSTGGTNNE
jgi:hypothetical protein